jgi:rhomboid protease GluP
MGSGNPRHESFTKMLALTCCPTLSLKSVIVIMTILEIIMFFISIILTAISKVGFADDAEFLEPNIIVLNLLGCKYPYEMKKGEIHRFILPILLHANFLHIFLNLIAQLINGWIEIVLGPKKMLALYLISGIGGNLFSALISDGLAVGASTAILGILGSHLSYLFVYWKALERFGFMRSCLLIQSIFIIIICLTIGWGFERVDAYGHIGGLITGVLLGIVLFTPLSTEGGNGKNWRMAAGGALIIYFLVGILCFFLSRNPVNNHISELSFK